MEPFIIRSAELGELPALLAFEAGIIETERPFDVTLRDGEIHYYDIAYMIKAENIYVAVALSGTEIIGSGYARIEDSKVYLKHPKHAYLGFMYVKPAFRGMGVNNAIIDALRLWSAARGITEMRLEVYELNLPAIKAYEKFGFSKLLITMRMGT